MPLSKEQFSALRSKGLSTEQIAKFDSGYKPSNKSPFNFGEIAKPFTDPSKTITGQAPLEAMTTAYEQTKKPLKETLNLPKSGVSGLLTDLGIDVASGVGADALVASGGRALAKSAPKLLGKAEQLVPKLLPPEPGTIAGQLQHGGEKIYQKELAPFIKKSKSYEDLSGKLRESKKALGGKREAIYEANPVVSEEAVSGVLDRALSGLGEAKKLGVLDKNQLKKITDIIDNQVEFINNLPKDKATSTKFLQERKAAFQKMSDDIYGEALAPDEKINKQVFMDLAKGYQTALESLSSDIKPINRTLGALIEGTESAAKLGEKEATNIKPSGIEELLSRMPFISNMFPLNTAKQAGLSMARKSKEVPALSGKIEGLVNESKFRETLGGDSQVKQLLKRLFGGK